MVWPNGRISDANFLRRKHIIIGHNNTSNIVVVKIADNKLVELELPESGRAALPLGKSKSHIVFTTLSNCRRGYIFTWNGLGFYL